MEYRVLLLFSGVFISNTAFVVAAVLLYACARSALFDIFKYIHRLTKLLFKDADFAFTSAVLFCFNPASIFMSALYTESLFAALLFASLIFTIQNKFLIASLVRG